MSSNPHPYTDDTPLSTVLAVIESVMKRAEDITKQTAEDHMQAFTRQMQEKVGVASVSLNEPYLPLLLKEGEVRFLTKLERFFYQMDGGEPPEHVLPEPEPIASKWLLPRRLEYKAINLKKPLLPQVEDRLSIETIRYQLGLKQELDAKRQQAFGISQYIWHTRGDDKVRPGHAAYDGQVRTWGEGEAPGESYNCRCWAEPVPEGAGMPKVEVTDSIEVAGLGKIAFEILKRVATSRRVRQATERLLRAKPKMSDTKTWPKPPKKGNYQEGLPSRSKPRNRGEKSLYDEKGGEWRYFKGDKYHNPHWDYKPSGKGQGWENISIDDLPPLK